MFTITPSEIGVINQLKASELGHHLVGGVVCWEDPLCVDLFSKDGWDNLSQNPLWQTNTLLWTMGDF